LTWTSLVPLFTYFPFSMEESVLARTCLPLALLMLCVFADDPHNAAAINHLAFNTNLFN
jgi:hypothetical protein